MNDTQEVCWDVIPSLIKSTNLDTYHQTLAPSGGRWFGEDMAPITDHQEVAYLNAVEAKQQFVKCACEYQHLGLEPFTKKHSTWCPVYR